MTFQAGVGYDFLSQQYFLDSTIFEGPDSLLTEWALKTNYLDDVKGRFTITYQPYLDNFTNFHASYEQTAEFVRIRSLTDLRFTTGRSGFHLNSEFEWRSRYRDTAQFGDSYFSGNMKATYTVPLGKSWDASAQLVSDGVSFQSPSDYAYNYYRLGGKLKLTKSLQDFSYVDARLFVLKRTVPDSLALNYLSYGIESSLLSFFDIGEVDLYTRIERKDYNEPENKDDYTRWELTGRGKITLSQKWAFKQELNAELALYHPDDPINYNYGRLGLALLGQYGTGDANIACGPVFEFLSEQENDFSETEDYFESGIKIDIDYLRLERWYFSLQSVTGRRNLRYENDLQSDFSFERIDVISDVKLFSVMSLNVLFSAEWEWHTQAQQNSQLYLLSTILSYRF